MNLKSYLVYFQICFLITFSVCVHAKEELSKVSLQLLWLHQFEFAGYYIAKEKGYYQELGLEVDLKEYQQDLDITENVISGKSDFGIGNSSLILDKLAKKPIYLLAAILQKSPFILLSLKRDDINIVADLKNKNIMLEANQMDMAALSAMLKVNNISNSDFTKQVHSFKVDDLIQGKADAMSAYISNEPYLLKIKGETAQIFNPVKYGFSFYSDILFTSDSFYQNNKQITDKFYQASIKGWLYAFDNIQETAQLIYDKYNTQNKTLEHLVFEANELKKLSMAEGIDFGEFKIDIINQIIQTYKLLEINNNNLEDYNFIYPKALYQGNKFDYDLLWKILFIAFVLFSGLYYWNRKLSALNTTIAKNSKKISLLLDNAGQGFLTFNKDLIIDSEYSKECLKIFKKEIVDLNIADILYTKSHKKEFFITTLSSLLKETNQLKIKTIISLLQSEFIINKKAIHLEYKIVDNDKFMLVLTDITAKKILQKKINREKNTLKMIVAVVSDSEEFFELNDEFEKLIATKSTLVDSTKTPLHNATEIYRIIHTFKGLFSQKEMVFIVANLHQLETELSNTISSQENTNDKLQNLLDSSDLQTWFLKDINIIKDILGNELFSKRGNISVNEKILSRIENNIVSIAEKHHDLEDYKSVVSDIRNLKNRSIYSLFSSYPKLIDQLSTRLNKSIYPLEIIVDKDIKVNEEIKPFIKSLVHIFRNSVDHGIESMDDRVEIDKDEIGTISCTIEQRQSEQQESNLHIVIADDGQGLDIDKIKQKALSLSMDIDQLTDNEVQQLIFNDQFSTKEEVTKTSGRGVGMAVVKNEIDKLNGHIKIKSQKNVGTTFELIVPLKSKS
jgi:two-component system chemotaxis sensor kinase CheA